MALTRREPTDEAMAAGSLCLRSFFRLPFSQSFKTRRLASAAIVLIVDRREPAHTHHNGHGRKEADAIGTE